MPFSDFIGHRGVKETLRRGLSAGKLPHAMLFCGPSSVGKRLLAKHLACALNCRTGNPIDWCGHCAECRQIMTDQHSDVVTITVESAAPDKKDKSEKKDSPEKQKQFISIEQIRALIADAGMLPFQGKEKIFLLDKAHAMQAPAANALLKILEEPPATSKLILITPQPDALLPTIRSRCRVFRFTPLADQEVALILQQTEGCSPQEAEERARRSEGCVEGGLRLKLGERQKVEQSVQRFLEMTAQRAPLSQAAELLAEPAKENTLTQEWLRQLLRSLRLHMSNWAQGDPAALFSLRQINVIAEAVENLRRGLEHNVNRPLALENLYLRCRQP